MKFIKNTINNEPFDSSMLNIGEMMECNDKDIPHYKGVILLRITSSFVCLSIPNESWSIASKIRGRKLFPDESVTLIQE